MPLTNVRNVLRMLEDAGMLVRTADDPPRFVPGRAPEEIRLRDLLDVIRRYGEDDAPTRQPVSTPAIDDLERRLDDVLGSALSGKTLRDLSVSTKEPIA